VQPSEKLEMTGEPVNISNIEKKEKNLKMSDKLKMLITINTGTKKTELEK
jgi:hypothetical protein